MKSLNQQWSRQHSEYLKPFLLPFFFLPCDDLLPFLSASKRKISLKASEMLLKSFILCLSLFLILAVCQQRVSSGDFKYNGQNGNK